MVNYIMENIKSRRSVRSYLDRAIPEELMEGILEAARFAPSALNKQPWEFIVVTDKGLIKELSDGIRKSIKKLYGILPLVKLFNKGLRDKKTIAAIKKTATSAEDTVFYNAPALIFIVTSKSGGWVDTDCALAAQNMVLAAHSLGLGSCFIGRGFFLSKNKKLLKKIGMDARRRICATLIFGYPKESPKTAPERRRDNLVCWKK